MSERTEPRGRDLDALSLRGSGRSTGGRRRLGSWAWDYLVIAAWLAAVGIAFAVVGLAVRLHPSSLWSHPVAADLSVAMITVVPVLTYLVATEAGRFRATCGKRRSGLRVTPDQATAPPVLQLLARNAVKLAPWQLGHMAAMRFASGDDIPSGFAFACFAASMTMLVAVAGPTLLGRRGLHDLVAGTRVVSVDDDAIGATR